ncbi:hypothetical protein AWC19_19910 [Mycobacterium palustre]|uniref:Uncharacterized protein n=1 Tax=Mycobacterium palustre TaxID=153971 RepID=A0A1X1Z3J1_9MYCO|nr:hypothetical protein AWC19_19910 [Mycobacterium palustre]
MHSQLAIFGAIDELVLEARTGDNGSADRAVLTAAAKLMPNSTGFGEAGWYRELQRFVNRDGVRAPGRTNPIAFPTLQAATTELLGVPAPTPEAEASAEPSPATSPLPEPLQVPRAAPPSGLDQPRNPDGPGGFEDQTFYDSARDPVLARAGYAAFVLLKLGEIAGGLDQTLLDDLKSVVGVAVRSFVPPGDPGIAAMTDSITGAINDINSRQEWTAFVTDAVGRRFAEASKPCFGTLEEIDGKYCSTVVTDSVEPSLSVADIENIVDPMNWGLCSKFFCKMVQNTPNRNGGGWSRVQEQIGAECGEYRLITDLIFYKVCQRDGSIFINYDIDPQRRPPDLGYVKVDNGYIFVSPDNATNDPKEKGVRIRTSKQEHVDGLSPCATAALACLMGWADAGREMLAGTAQKIILAQQAGLPTPKLKVFYPSDQPDPGEQN